MKKRLFTVSSRFLSPNSVSDSGFHRRGANPKEGSPTYYLAIFSWKLHENEELLALGGEGTSLVAPTPYRSANGTFKEITDRKRSTWWEVMFSVCPHHWGTPARSKWGYPGLHPSPHIWGWGTPPRPGQGRGYRGEVQTGGNTPPNIQRWGTPGIGQWMEYLKHRSRYVSCVHAGLSC